jgi:hypothetical protein
VKDDTRTHAQHSVSRSDLPYLEVTYRRGQAVAAYYYLPRRSGQRSVRARRVEGGLSADRLPERAISDGTPLPSRLSQRESMDVSWGESRTSVARSISPVGGRPSADAINPSASACCRRRAASCTSADLAHSSSVSA